MNHRTPAGPIRHATRRIVTLAAALATNCQREPPPLANEMERPAFERAPDAPPPARVGGFAQRPRGRKDVSLATGPDFDVLGDRTTCTISVFRRGELAWRRVFPRCETGLTVAVRADHVILARVENLLVAWDPDGAEDWRLDLGGDGPPRALAPIASLADSHVVVAASPTMIVNVSGQGRETWRYSLPSDEPLLAAPRALPSEGLALVTHAGAWFLHNDGTRRRHVEGVLR